MVTYGLCAALASATLTCDAIRAMAAKQKDEDTMILQKYTRADESKIRELTLQMEKLNRDVLQLQVVDTRTPHQHKIYDRTCVTGRACQ